MTRQQILRLVAKMHFVTVSDITGPERFSDLVAARRDAIRRMRAAGFSLREVARALKRDYSTITHHCYPNVRAVKKAKAARLWRSRTPADRKAIAIAKQRRRRAARQLKEAA